MQATPEGSPPTPAPKRWVDIGASTEITDEGSLEVTVEGQLIAVFRHNGRLFAIEGLCAHHGGPLAQGVVAEGCVTCPWHGWQYHLSDGKHTASGAQLIQSYAVREHEGRVQIGLG